MNENLYRRENRSGRLGEFLFSSDLNKPSSYRCSEALEDAVNVALTLGQPLLLTGEPGTGKTQLAYHLADYFQLGEPLVFNVRTSSKYTDLFYQYRSLQHFQYSQNTKNQELNDEEIEEKFIRYQALGEAIRIAAFEKRRSIVLIDEIDKAPRDLPNDILGALEKLEFEIPEINKLGEDRISAPSAYRPIIILTSNSEKSLPDAFLRRCVFFHIEFPGQKELEKIILQKINDFSPSELTNLVKEFLRVREICQSKKPATSELLFWAAYLKKQNFTFGKLSRNLDLTSSDKAILGPSYSILAKSSDDLTTLWKGMSDFKRR